MVLSEMNKKHILISMLIFCGIKVLCQIEVSNSFDHSLKKKYPSLHYTYHDSSSTHNYSNNWDFDGDGRLDSLFFKGDGAVTLSFIPIIKSSILDSTYSLSSLSCDFPYLESKESLEVKDSIASFPKLVIGDFTNDGISDVYLKAMMNETGEKMAVLITFDKDRFKIERHFSKQ